MPYKDKDKSLSYSYLEALQQLFSFSFVYALISRDLVCYKDTDVLIMFIAEL